MAPAQGLRCRWPNLLAAWISVLGRIAWLLPVRFSWVGLPWKAYWATRLTAPSPFPHVAASACFCSRVECTSETTMWCSVQKKNAAQGLHSAAQGLHSAMARAIAMTFAVAASGGLGGTIESAGGGYAKRAALRAGFQHTCRPHECCNANSACLQVCCLMFFAGFHGNGLTEAREVFSVAILAQAILAQAPLGSARFGVLRSPGKHGRGDFGGCGCVWRWHG